MTGTINPDQIKGLKIFDSASQHLPLCGSHNRELSEEIAGDLDDLVHSHFFQEKFGALFPEDLAGAHLNMRLKDNSLIVQLMREESSGRRLAPEGEAVVIDLTAPADEETIEINQTILDKADALFRKCQNGHIRSHRSTAAPSLRDRAVDLTRFSNDDLLDELAARRHDTIDDLVPTPRRTRSASPDRLERRTRGTRENPDDTLRGARQAQLNLQIQAERLSRDSDATDEQLIPLYEQIRRLEEQIQRLSEQLGAPASTTATRASDSTPLLERVLDRLARINERLDLLEGSRTVPTTTPSPDRTDSLEQPDRTARREEDSGSRAARSDSTEQTDLASQREADLENALRRARQDYLDLQREADLLSRRPNPTIEQLAPFLERIR
ncbi:MAG: hypothetical protein JSR39_10455, partial [Verrucomicrobia bacterium]|nr:hypothetical protein [Verrucomicrobiota bacterium]